jgi:glycosyltransferase involved in cell wall biosynthesis
MTTKRPIIVDTALVKGVSQRAASPHFSIILCTYNRRNLVLTTLASLRRQTLPYDQFEVIVVDNGSNDGTLSAVRTYISAGVEPGRNREDMWNVQCLAEPQNGLAHARYTGLLAASGEIAVFLDDDTIADPNLLECLLAAYRETGADAIGGRVEPRMEARRPHWLTDDLLDMLGYYAPSPIRIQLPRGSSFSNSNFSVRIEALRSIGYFSPFLSKRLHQPTSLEIADLCERLAQAGYTLWYEPSAVAAHRISSARLCRSFFVGRAYWQGRSEVFAEYYRIDPGIYVKGYTLRGLIQVLKPELRTMLSLLFVHRPLLRLAGRPTSERIEAAMEQARCWGHIQQRFQFFEHAPIEVNTPAILLVQPSESDAAADLLAHALRLQDVACVQSEGVATIPLSWLWRHRAYQGQAIGVIHFYRPGALRLGHQQSRSLWFRLWLARCLGIRVVTTDTGGWWQSSRNPRFLSRRVFERKLFYSSDFVLAFTRQPDQLYPDKKLRRRVRVLPHPGFRGYYAAPIERTLARHQLGLPSSSGFVYLCLADNHTERELMRLIETFGAMSKRSASPGNMRLVLVGCPGDKKRLSTRLLKLAAINPAVHLFPTMPRKTDIPLYLGASDAIVLPHFALQKAGALETALLALSFGLAVVAPNLPRFRGMLPPRASVLYDPSSSESLINACLKAQTLQFCMSEKEEHALEAESGWGQYAHRLIKLYRRILA